MISRPKELELLAPAKDAAVAIEAINHGADAVYIGAMTHNARQGASNSLSAIKSVTEYAHRFNCRVYVTLNTLIYENELLEVEHLIKELYRINVDALIVQDFGILRLDIPPIALHASTQCDIRNIETALLLEGLGFSQAVLAREMTPAEIKEIHSKTSIPLEVFVHGALCVSFSGCCNAGYLYNKRSGNRGECPQLCRLNYDLVDGNGKKVFVDKHLLSLKDMNRIHRLEDLIDAGATSFKIEGRLKDVQYVKNVVGAYRQKLDQIIASSGGKYKRSSDGVTELLFEPDLSKSFNRGYIDYFALEKKDSACFDTPKSKGERIGEVTGINGNKVEVKLSPGITLRNGDGLTIIDRQNKLQGFRINRVDKNTIFTLKPLTFDIKDRNNTLYRNYDIEWEKNLSKVTAVRKLVVHFKIDILPSGNIVVMEARDENGNYVTATRSDDSLKKADKLQHNYRRNLFGKLGNTYWTLGSYEDRAENVFIPASELNALKRDILELLEKCRANCRIIDYRHKENPEKVIKALSSIDEIHNIANSQAARLFKDYDFHRLKEATETASKLPSHPRVMECKYCLRKEIDACLKTPGGKVLQGPLELWRNGKKVYELQFDCSRCRMSVIR